LGNTTPALNIDSWVMRVNKAQVALDGTYANWSSDGSGWNNCQRAMTRINQLNIGSENYVNSGFGSASGGATSDYNQDFFQGWMFNAAIYTSTVPGGALNPQELAMVESVFGAPLGI
jgi:hypothetical protein